MPPVPVPFSVHSPRRYTLLHNNAGGWRKTKGGYTSQVTVEEEKEEEERDTRITVYLPHPGGRREKGKNILAQWRSCSNLYLTWVVERSGSPPVERVVVVAEVTDSLPCGRQMPYFQMYKY